MSVCEKCNRSYNSVKALQRHDRVFHKESRYLCLCGRGFTRSENLKLHSMNCNGKTDDKSYQHNLENSLDYKNSNTNGNLNFIDNPTKRVRLNSDVESQNYEGDNESGSDKSQNDSDNEGDILSENSDTKSESNKSDNDSEPEVDVESECSTCKSESVGSNLTNGSGDDSGDDYNSGKDQSSSDMDVNESDVKECDCRECRRDMIKNINKGMPQNKLNDADSFASDLEDEFEQRSENNYQSNSPSCPYRKYYTNQAKFGQCVATVPYNSGSSGSLLNGIMRTSVPLVVGDEK